MIGFFFHPMKYSVASFDIATCLIDIRPKNEAIFLTKRTRIVGRWVLIGTLSTETN